MTDEDRIRQVLYQYEESGLVTGDIGNVLALLTDDLLGIGIGEQGFVSSKEDVLRVYRAGIKEDIRTKHSISYENLHIRVHQQGFANLCVKVIVEARNGEKISTSQFQQSLTLVRCGEDWKICGLHASVPLVTEEIVEAYPLKFAEKTLQSLREKLGEEAFLAKEQYRQAILADAVAFYMINFSADVFEKCQLNGDLCAYVEPGTPYEQFMTQLSPACLLRDDQEKFLEIFSLAHIERAFEEGKKELTHEYPIKCANGSLVWMVTIVRLIIDAISGEHKGIMYVKNIDESKRRELEMISKADTDCMTGVLNKSAFMRLAGENLMENSFDENSAFIMLDIDNFKGVNDTFGHPAGDRVLMEVSRLLKDNFGEENLVGRLGGDEFGVLIKRVWNRERLCCRLSCFQLQVTGIRVEGIPPAWPITCSIGVSMCTVRDILKVYKSADRALYFSKQKGKNCYSFDTGGCPQDAGQRT